jgi:hypothetical protein
MCVLSQRLVRHAAVFEQLGSSYYSCVVVLQAHPAALVATAKRTFRDATGVDLSACTRWC